MSTSLSLSLHYITCAFFSCSWQCKEGGEKGKEREKKRRPVSVNDDVVLFAAVKVAAVPEALLTLLSRLCVGTLDLYIQACKKTNREIKTKERCGLTGR